MAFEVVPRSDAVELGVCIDDGRYDDFGWCVIERRSDGTVHLIGEDGGEPEDQRLVRDWSWVAPALNEAAVRACREERERVLREIEAAINRPWPSHYGHSDPMATAGANCSACIQQRELKDSVYGAISRLREGA